MWTNSMLKQNGLANFKKNRWACVVVCLIMGIVAGGSGGSAGNIGSNASRNATSNGQFDFSNIDWDVAAPILLGILVIALIAMAIGLAIKICVFNPLEVGCQRFFLVNRATENAQISNVAFGFKSNWKNIVKTMFFTHLYLFLWSCLCFIPGIIKGYSYRLVPYILADNPDMDTNDAITLSRAMMDGQKMNAFVFDLSFIGWFLLSVLTCGILAILYVAPYKRCSDAELYTAIKETYNPQPVM